ncbi:hypothetical protein [Hydrogenophaga sp. BPS33]|nr:hypothetical protein [Hydrogenophaga sp. BPS33]
MVKLSRFLGRDIRVSTIEKMRRHYIEQGIVQSDAVPLGRIYDESVVR